MNRSLFLLILLAPFTAFLVAGCGGGGGGAAGASLEPAISTREEAAQPGTWTILVYLDADNDLESAGIHNFNQMEMIGSTKDVRIIVQMDRFDGEDRYNESWTDTRRYLILRDLDIRRMNSLRLDVAPLGEKNMADWRTLQDFVEWGVREFPADHYCLIIWDHGTGWEIRTLATAPEYKYVIVDDTGGFHQMNVTDIPLALQNVQLDVIAFDACYMQQLEVAYQLRNCARYLVGSAAAEPSPGYDYVRMLGRMGASTTPEQLCSIIVDSFAAEYPPPRKGITQSAVDLNRISDVADAASSLAQVLSAEAGRYSTALRDARLSALNYSTCTGGDERYSLDLIDYADRCAAAVNGTAAINAAAQLRSALEDAIIAEIHNPDTPTAHGLGVYVPPPTRFDTNYRLLQFASDTLWDEWIQVQSR